MYIYYKGVRLIRAKFVIMMFLVIPAELMQRFFGWQNGLFNSLGFNGEKYYITSYNKHIQQ